MARPDPARRVLRGAWRWNAHGVKGTAESLVVSSDYTITIILSVGIIINICVISIRIIRMRTNPIVNSAVLSIVVIAIIIIVVVII